MEALLIKWFGDLALLVVPLFAGIFCSFIIEGINQVTPQGVSGKLITVLVTVLFGTVLAFGFSEIVQGWFDKFIIISLNWAFALLFYHLGGKRIVKSIVGYSVKVVGRKIDG